MPQSQILSKGDEGCFEHVRASGKSYRDATSPDSADCVAIPVVFRGRPSPVNFVIFADCLRVCYSFLPHSYAQFVS